MNFSASPTGNYRYPEWQAICLAALRDHTDISAFPKDERRVGTRHGRQGHELCVCARHLEKAMIGNRGWAWPIQ